MDNENCRQQGFVQSVERALDILECLSHAGHPMRALDMAQAVGLNNNTAHNLIRTLHQRGYLDQLADAKYRLGRQAYELSSGCDRWEALRPRLLPVLQELSRQTGDCAFLGVREDSRLRCAALTEGTGAIRVSISQDWESQLHCTAAGKTLLAWDEGFAEAFLSSSRKLEKPASKTIVDADGLRRNLAESRKRGYVLAINESAEHVASIGVPVLDKAGRIVCALAQSFPAFYLEQELVDPKERAALLAQAARKLRIALEG